MTVKALVSCIVISTASLTLLTILNLTGHQPCCWEPSLKNDYVEDSDGGRSVPSKAEADSPRDRALRDAVLARTSAEGVIFIAAVDFSFTTLAANLYETSFRRLNITNYLFVGLDAHVCDALQRAASVAVAGSATSDAAASTDGGSGGDDEIACVRYLDDADGANSSDWGSTAFRRKTHYKTRIVLAVLRLGVVVVIVDVDIVFFRDPLPFLGCTSCDVQIQNDLTEGNSGFYMARPTPAAIELHEKAYAIGIRRGNKMTNQKALDRTMERMGRQRRIKVRTLNLLLFPCGVQYFEENRIMFAGDGASCHGCVLVHNNWIVSREAKVYRFRETGLWDFDGVAGVSAGGANTTASIIIAGAGYYTSTDRLYLLYDTPLDFGPLRTFDEETDALKAALWIGRLINRTVILSTFHCYGCKYAACKNAARRCSLDRKSTRLNTSHRL